MKIIHSKDKTHIIRLEKGEELVEQVTNYCRDKKIYAGWVQGLGAGSHSAISYYDINKKQYLQNEIKRNFEILNLTGNISIFEKKPTLHAHVTLGFSDQTTLGGHLHNLHISGTGEIIINELDGEITREKDADTGLSLLRSQ